MRESNGYLVEYYWPGVTRGELGSAVSRASDAVRRLTEHGGDLRFVASILVPTDETVFWFFTGEERDVRAVSEHARVSHERVLEAVLIEGDPATTYERSIP